MPYISKEEVKTKRELLKKALPDYKLSVVCRDYCEIRVAIVSGNIKIEPTYQQVNPFYIKDNYENEPELKNLLLKIKEIINEGNYTASEDGDYGSIPSFYIAIHIGKWDKPYQQIIK